MDTPDAGAPHSTQQQQQQQEQQLHHRHNQHHQQQQPRTANPAPADLRSVLAELSRNAAAIGEAQLALQQLLSTHSTLHRIGRKLEQQQVLLALQRHHQQLGFSRGRPVAAVLLFRCMQHWGLLHETQAEAASPFLEQLAALLQQGLESSEDASAPADVAGVQSRVAGRLALCAVLYCVLLKAAAPELAAAAAASRRGSSKGPSAAAEVAAAARKVAATLSHQMAALGRLKWGFKRQAEAAAGAEEPAGTRHGSSSSTAGGSHDHLPAHEQQAPRDLSAEPSAAAAAAGSVGQAPAGSAAPGSPTAAAAAAMSATTMPEPLEGFLLCLDQLVQQAFTLLRDQLKRRLSPLLADCVTPSDTDGMGDGSGSGSQQQGAAGNQPPAAAAPAGDAEAAEPLSPSAAGAAVAGEAAASAAHAEAALLTYRSWSELTGVLHAATVELRAAHVPHTLRAALIELALAFVNAQLFNQLLLRPECCSVSNARYALRGLKQLDTWIVAEQSSHHAVPGAPNSCGDPTPPPAAAAAGSPRAAAAAAVDIDAGWEQVPADAGEFDAWQPHQQQWWPYQRKGQGQQQQQAGPGGEQPELGPEAWAALSHIRQALQFLVLDSEHKAALTLEDLTQQFCPALTPHQLYRLCTTAWDEAPAVEATAGVSGEVLEALQEAERGRDGRALSNGGLLVMFLLDEPAGPPPFVAAAAAAAADGATSGRPPLCSSGSSAGRCRPGDVVAWDDGRDYGVALPRLPALEDEGCPSEVFSFLSLDAPYPPHTVAAASVQH